jgi:peptidoglycan hydrolase-like protein with peptidoglycan-binding domain
MRNEGRMSVDDRKRVQEALHRLGYYNGPVGGDFGPLTRSAIRDYQRNIGSQPTGHLNASEADRLVTTQ